MGYAVHAQRFSRSDSDWKISVGVNALGSTGSRNPIRNLDQLAFINPLALAVEHQWSQEFALEQDLSFNGFRQGAILYGAPLEGKDLNYFSTNTNIKWYFTNYLFNAEWLDLYISGGIGIFKMDKLTTSANVSGGTQYWFSDHIAVRLQASIKLATNPTDHPYADSHFQYAFLVVYRL